jgi:hypothetical protein
MVRRMNTEIAAPTHCPSITPQEAAVVNSAIWAVAIVLVTLAWLFRN